MRLTFFGAAGEVTGSCTLLETSGARVLIDFGMHQGGAGAERRNRRIPPIDPSKLDVVLLTHAHLDHCGRLPLLPGAGFGGVIHATRASCDLAELILRDSAGIQESDAERESRRRARRGREPVKPLYTTADVDFVMERFRPIRYDERREVAPGVSARFVDAGHILGSASIELRISEHGSERVIVFSGDIGEKGTPLLRDPTPFAHADLVVMESTYGDRDHRGGPETIDELALILGRARTEGGVVLIPAFAVGRTQQLIYNMGVLERSERLRSTRVVIDSPMAISATELYRRYRDIFDEDAWEIIEAGDSPLNFSKLEFSRSTDESKALNNLHDGTTIIAASGMCTGGRVLHHLKHNLWRDDAHVVFVGYQAAGTLGRQIVEGKRAVRVLGEEVGVRAKVHTLGGFSAHAGRTGLLDWAGSFRESRPRVALNHGEDGPRRSLAARLRELYAYHVELPSWGGSVELGEPSGGSQ